MYKRQSVEKKGKDADKKRPSPYSYNNDLGPIDYFFLG